MCLLLMSHSGPHFYLLQIQIEGKISPIIFLYTARVGWSINLVEENSFPQSLFPCFIVWGLWSDKILYLDISTSFVLDNLKSPNKRYHSVSAKGAKNSNVCLDIFLEFILFVLQVTLEQHTDPAFF